MREELEEIKAAWDKGVGYRDEDLARSLADTFVENNPELFNEIRTKSLDQLCQDIDVFRQAGFEEQVWLVETWLLHEYEPQNIGGLYSPQIRVPGGSENA